MGGEDIKTAPIPRVGTVNTNYLVRADRIDTLPRCFARGNEQLYVELQKLDCVLADELAVVLLADCAVLDHFV